jgi:large subunit ribosomal protein L35
MPKMKTNSSAKKRFKVSASGKVKYKQAYSRHMMMNKPKSMKRKARGTDTMIPGDERLVLRNYLPNDKKKLKATPRRDAKKYVSKARRANAKKEA